MRINKLIKSVFEREVEGNLSGIPPFPGYVQKDSGKSIKTEKRHTYFMDIGLAACFIIVFFVSVFFRDSIFRSPLANQGEFFAQVLSENSTGSSGKTLYDFILAIRSSF
jgi:hypothetical protein